MNCCGTDGVDASGMWYDAPDDYGAPKPLCRLPPWIPKLPEPPMVCDNSKCSRQLSFPCAWPYAYTFDRRCTPLAANDPYMDDFVPFLLERCAKDEHLSLIHI